jgi:hypothetical protein
LEVQNKDDWCSGRRRVVMQREWMFCIPDVKAALSVAARLKLKLRLGVFAHPNRLHHHNFYQMEMAAFSPEHTVCISAI